MANIELLTQERIAQAIYSWTDDEYGWGDYYGALGGNFDINEDLEKYVCSDKKIKSLINKGVSEGDYCDIEDAMNYMPCISGGLNEEHGQKLLYAIIDYFYTHPAAMQVLGQEILKHRSMIDDEMCIETAEAMSSYTGGIKPKVVKEQMDLSGRPQVLAGLRVVFTGKSQFFTGDDVEKFIEAHGAKCSHKVDKNTDLLVCGDKPGQKKVDAAEQLGIREMSEDEFFSRFDLNPETGQSYSTPDSKFARHDLIQDARRASAEFANELLNDDEDFDFDKELEKRNKRTVDRLPDVEIKRLARIQNNRQAEIKRMEEMLEIVKNSTDEEYKKFFSRLVTMVS